MKPSILSPITKLISLLLILVITACSSDSTPRSTFIDDSSNPYEMHFVSDSKAYILRYGSPSIWIVDPSVSAADEENFKIGEINLGAYDDDGIPNMSTGLISNNKLFVVMQAMDSNYVPGDAYLSVMDMTTDT